MCNQSPIPEVAIPMRSSRRAPMPPVTKDIEQGSSGTTASHSAIFQNEDYSAYMAKTSAPPTDIWQKNRKKLCMVVVLFALAILGMALLIQSFPAHDSCHEGPGRCSQNIALQADSFEAFNNNTNNAAPLANSNGASSTGYIGDALDASLIQQGSGTVNTEGKDNPPCYMNHGGGGGNGNGHMHDGNGGDGTNGRGDRNNGGNRV